MAIFGDFFASCIFSPVFSASRVQHVQACILNSY